MDYENASLYIIKHKEDTNNEICYIGSSKNFQKRLISHKSNCFNPNCKDYNMKVYQYIRSNGDFNNFVIEELIKFPCISKIQLKTEEKKLIKGYNATLNSYMPNRTAQEYYHENSARISTINKERYKSNPSWFIEKAKKYYNDNKLKLSSKCICTICGCSIRQDYMTKHIKRPRCKKIDTSVE